MYYQQKVNYHLFLALFGQTQGKESCIPQTQPSGHLPLAPGHPTKTWGKKTLSMHSIIRSDTYHIWVKRGCNLLINEIIPVNWGEEDVILNLHLLREKNRLIQTQANVNSMSHSSSRTACGHWPVCTYKVLLGTKSLCPVLLQEAFQEMSSWVGNIWLQLQGFVQDIVVHFCGVPAVEGRLWEAEKEELMRLTGRHGVSCGERSSKLVWSVMKDLLLTKP